MLGEQQKNHRDHEFHFLIIAVCLRISLHNSLNL